MTTPIKPKPVALTTAEALKLVQTIPRERRRFHAPSRSGGELWLVDLEENDFEGKCGCPDHTCRKHRCWHIKLCMLWWYNQKIREESAQDNGGPQ